MKRWFFVLVPVSAILAALAGYLFGHRAGRGACFEVAVHVPDSQGRTLYTEILSRERSTSDYSFWGDFCTLTLGYYNQNGEWVGGRWRYIPTEAKLYADNNGALRLFSASGLWQLPIERAGSLDGGVDSRSAPVLDELPIGAGHDGISKLDSNE